MSSKKIVAIAAAGLLAAVGGTAYGVTASSPSVSPSGSPVPVVTGPADVICPGT